MVHVGLDRRQIKLRVLVRRQLDVLVFLQKSLGDGVGEVPLGDGFLHSSQPAA